MDSGSSRGDVTGSMDRRKFLFFASSATAASASALVVPWAVAQSAAYPVRPVTLVVTYPPGNAPDILARIFASELPTHLGQNVIVENKAGAAGSMGVAAVARAKNDGYTLCLVSPAPLVINPSLYGNLTYDPIKDFTPVIKLAGSSNLLLVPAQSPASSVQELMRQMKERKKENSLQFNSAGNGTTQHLLGVLLAKLAGASTDHVPYRGTPDQLTALVTGQVDFGFCALSSSISLIKSGRLRALGITSIKPSALLPDVPSLSSAGLEGFDKTELWFGVVGPKDMPDSVVRTLHGALAKVLANPDIQAKLVAAGFEPVPPASASEFAQFIRDQFAFWRDLVRGSGASND
jgi:tripartite-type tricarboxylate transporter receptor subunit TctC